MMKNKKLTRIQEKFYPLHDCSKSNLTVPEIGEKQINKKSIMDYAGSTTGLYGNTTEKRQAYLKNERDSWE